MVKEGRRCAAFGWGETQRVTVILVLFVILHCVLSMESVRLVFFLGFLVGVGEPAAKLLQVFHWALV